MKSRRLLIPALFAVVATACGDGVEQLATRKADSPAGSKEVAPTEASDDHGQAFYEGPVAHQPSVVNRSWSEAVEVNYSSVGPGWEDWERGLSLEIAVHESWIRNLDFAIRYFLPEAPDTAQFFDLAPDIEIDGTRPGTTKFWRVGSRLPAVVAEPGARLELCGIQRGSLPYDPFAKPTVYDCSDFTVGEFRDVATVWQPDLPSEKDPPFDFDQTGGVRLTGGGIALTIDGIAVPRRDVGLYSSSNQEYVIPVTATTTNSVPTTLPSIYSTIFTESGRICYSGAQWAPPANPSRAMKISPGETIVEYLAFSCNEREIPDPTRPGERAFVPRPIPITEQALLIVQTRGLIESYSKLLISITN